MPVRNFTPAEERAEIERLARIMAGAQYGIDPDVLCLMTEAPRLRDGPLVVPLGGMHPLWTMFTGAAKAIFDDQRRQEELYGVTSDVD